MMFNLTVTAYKTLKNQDRKHLLQDVGLLLVRWLVHEVNKLCGKHFCWSLWNMTP
jgi:hypothetical protein